MDKLKTELMTEASIIGNHCKNLLLNNYLNTNVISFV